MSAITGISSSASVTYATQLAQTSALKRNLNKLDTAVQSGDLDSAASILTAFVKANPQFAATAAGDSTSQDPINQDFQNLAAAISNHQTEGAQSAWAQAKTDLAKNGVTDFSDGTAATAELLAKAKASISQQIVSNALGGGSGSSLSVTSLLGGGGDSGGAAGVSSSLLSNWLTYRAGGATTSPVTTDSTGQNLNTAA